MADDIEITFTDDGDLQAVYSDDLAELFAGEALETRRASHVEPYASGWLADMRPVGGPVLGENGRIEQATLLGAVFVSPAFPPDKIALVQAEPLSLIVPFRTRQAALDAEVAWLRERMAAGTVEARP